MHYPVEADDKVDIQILLIDSPGVSYEETIPFLPYPGLFEIFSGMNSNYPKLMEKTHCTGEG